MACSVRSAPTPPTVVIDGCDSGVADVLLPSGCSITESILAIAEGAKNHGAFVSGTTHFANDLRKDGWIENQDKGAITRCAAWANQP